MVHGVFSYVRKTNPEFGYIRTELWQYMKSSYIEQISLPLETAGYLITQVYWQPGKFPLNQKTIAVPLI